MNAYFINDTELFFDESPDKALAHHLELTGGEPEEEAWEVRVADPERAWLDEDDRVSTVGELLAAAKGPCYMGSTEA